MRYPGELSPTSQNVGEEFPGLVGATRGEVAGAEMLFGVQGRSIGGSVHLAQMGGNRHRKACDL